MVFGLLQQEQSLENICTLNRQRRFKWYGYLRNFFYIKMIFHYPTAKSYKTI